MRNFTKFNFLWRISTICLLFSVMGSCQKESVVIVDESEEQNLTEASNLKTLLHNIALHDGSFDDLIDGASCFSIQFPYQLQVNEEIKTISNKNDLFQISSETRILLLKFPITIANANHIEEVVSSPFRLLALAAKCTSIDDDIECIDIQYPITIASFNTRSDNLTTQTINHDRDLYFLTLNTILENKLSIQYPITVRTKDGETIQIMHNEELESIIAAFEGTCDEEDF